MGRQSYRPRTHGVKTSTHDNNALLVKSIKTLTRPITPERMREYLREGYCPWCETSGWKVLSLHTVLKHGLSADDLRDIAGLFTKAPTCTPDISAKRRDKTLELLASGERVLPPPHPKGQKNHTRNRAYRAFVREVQVPQLLANSSVEQRKVRAVAAGLKNRKSHPCTACGKMMPMAHPLTCSPECRREIRRKTGGISAATRAAAGEEYKQAVGRKISETRKARFATGQLQPVKPAKPHLCPVCGMRIPKAYPVCCSVECGRENYLAAMRRRRATAEGIVVKDYSVVAS